MARRQPSKSPTQATAYKVHFSVEEAPGFAHVEGLKQESADKVSELLMLNHSKYHALYNDVGLHNHIVHHLCSLWALGASPAEIQAAYDLNVEYQLPQDHHGASTSLDLTNATIFSDNLGQPEAYSDYLHFFQDAIARKGVEAVVTEYSFKGDERADDLLGRLYSGFEHPILHLGFALEFKQPCLVAEALASACIHDDWPLPIVLPTEVHLNSRPNTPRKSLLAVLHDLRFHPEFANAVKTSNHPNHVIPLMEQAGSVLPPILAQWRVEPNEEDIRYRTAEMAHVCAYMLGAAQHPRKELAIEFFMMHSVNLSVFCPTFCELEWLSLEQKARLLMWKGWMDAALYAANACPVFYPERITKYTPKRPGGWEGIIARVNRYPDDGHTVKIIRALINVQDLSAQYTSSNNPDLPLRQEDFLQIAHIAIDSVERMLEPGYEMPGNLLTLYRDRFGVDEEVVKIVARFVRWAGIEESWDGFPDLKDAKGEKSKL